MCSLILISLLLICGVMGVSKAQPQGCNSSKTSWLVSLDKNNRLKYAGYVNEGETRGSNKVPDFSNVGYQGGGVPIPFVPAAIVVNDDGPADDTARIQRAINAVSSLPLDSESGFRGAVLLTAGNYTVSRRLIIQRNGVVIRGQGSQRVGGTRITYTASNQSNLFEVDHGEGDPEEVAGTRQEIVDEFVPVGAKSFQVAHALGFSSGDRVILRYKMNQKWLDNMSNMSRWGWNTSDYQLQYRRVIVAVHGRTVTIDAPVVQAIRRRFGGGELFKYTFESELENIGFEGMRLESTYRGETDEKHGWNAINMLRTKNGWVRQVTGLYFGNGLVQLDHWCHQITVEDCAMLEHKSRIKGGRRYSFHIENAEFILVQRCFTREGRHDFVSGARASGPNVFVDCRADSTHSDIGPHHRYSTGQLYDNIMGGEINVQNRRHLGTGHGWSGAQVMIWNCRANVIICDAPHGAMNWAVGNVGTKHKGKWVRKREPLGTWDSHNEPVCPRSLYYTQLSERMGTNSLDRVLLPSQKSGNIWTELSRWGGDGLFLDPLVVWADEPHVDFLSVPSVLVPIGGIVRNLNMLDSSHFVSFWSKVSGPGRAWFANSDALETTVLFDRSGFYVLQLMVDDGNTIEAASLGIEVAIDAY